jgi:hypothetical protein
VSRFFKILIVFVVVVFTLYTVLFLFLKNTCPKLTYYSYRWKVWYPAEWKVRSFCEWGGFSGIESIPGAGIN